MFEKGGRLIPMGFDDTYEMKVKPFQLLSNGVTIVGTGEARQIMEAALACASDLPHLSTLITEKVKMDNFEEAIHNLMGIDPATKEKRKLHPLRRSL